jgi:BioD-like phosphotransacetylase family protein
VDDLLKKIRNIEQEVIKKLQGLSGGDDNFTFNFNAHEETLTKMEDQILGVEQDFIAVKTRLSEEVQNAVDLCKRTREDYVLRMKEIQTDHNNVVDDTKVVIASLKTKYDTVFSEFRVDLN